MNRICNTCGEEKDSVRDFYVSNNRACCKKCMPQNQKVEHSCITCGAVRYVTKQNLRQSKGQCRSCSNIEKANSPEARKRMSDNARVQVLAQGGVPNAKKFTKERMNGANHHNWKGGITPEVMRIRNSEETKEWRKAVFERDNYTCQSCFQRGGRLCAHHLKEFSRYPELRMDVNNGQTLCLDCHAKTHNYGRKSKKTA